MSTAPEIPFGYKRVTDHAQRGDGRWNGERFVPVRTARPVAKCELVIRLADVTQPDIPGTVTHLNFD